MIAITTSSSTSVNAFRLDEFFISLLSESQKKQSVQSMENRFGTNRNSHTVC